MQDVCSGSSIEVGGGISRVGQSRPRHWMWDLVRAGDGTGRMEKKSGGVTWLGPGARYAELDWTQKMDKAQEG